MELSERIKSLGKWGERIQNTPASELEQVFAKAQGKNGWFTKESCSYSLKEITAWLKPELLENWLAPYEPKVGASKTVGLVMAGNIPLVGFHDLLCVLISGHTAKIKLSSQDGELLPFLTSLLVSVEPQWSNHFSYEDRLHNIDAVIATGSDNSARYFEYYFKSIPRIIRKNRTSVGVIMGEENPAEYQILAGDIFTYFGMGCRNVSKIFVPESFDLKTLIEPFSSHQEIINHNKYANNYDYQRAIRLISSKPFEDTGFLLMEESEELVSPIAVLYYQYYATQKQLNQLLANQKEKIQCIVSAKGWLKGSVPFGKAQQPELNDYADGVDTLKFLQGLN
jgi:hypothetical protein